MSFSRRLFPSLDAIWDSCTAQLFTPKVDEPVQPTV